MKKKLFILSGALLALMLSSCGGNNNNQEPAKGDDAPQGEKEQGPQDGGKTDPEPGKTDEGDKEEDPTDPAGPHEGEGEGEGEGQGENPPAQVQFTITFKDENGNILASTKWNEGAIPSYTYNVTDTQEWDYTFLGWSTSIDGDVITIPAATADATYFAIVNKVKQQYTITFESNGGTNVSSITVDYGTDVNEPDEPKKDGYKFVAWSYDQAGKNAVEWPLNVKKDETLYANWNETVDIKSYLRTLISAVNHDPYSYIPETMLPENSENHVRASDVTYDFSSFNNVSNIKYGGFGEQWHMVIENLVESERFYSVLSLGEAAINGSVALFNNYLDNNPGDTATHTLKETAYTAKLDFKNGLLQYTIQYKTNLNIPLFGEVLPQIDMSYDIKTLEKSVRIQLSENNAMKYIVTDNSYTFALEYGLSNVSRKAYFEISRDEEEAVEGHLYEYVQYKDKDLMPACADFYINDEYTSVVGNKASGMPGFTGFINELYETEEGKLLGYEVRETFEKWGFNATYHTLWFNLCDISGINSVKAIKNDNTTFGLGAANPYDIYLNGSSSIFTPTYNKVLLVQTSRKYDVEMRKQYFYGYNNGIFTEYEVTIPMMFIQADHDGYTNYSDFHDDILSKSNIDANVSLAKKYVDKIQEDYATLVDIFIANKDNMSGSDIDTYIGDEVEIAEN